MALQKIYKLRHFPKPLPSKVYLDANFLFHCRIASGKFYKVANALLSAFMIKRGCTLNVSTLALDEVWKKTPDVVAGRRVINNKHDWATNMPHFRSNLKSFIDFINRHKNSGKLNVIGVPANVTDDAHDIMVNTPIMPRDAFHVATALHHGIPDIVSRDKDLTNVNRNITVHMYEY